ncbi:type VI secretion system baseplate subunit TssE [Aliivibrio finisterrensis]|jgi:type VI secretion system protein|uniref:Type VI secretion system baseplate subunit TssE n=1 Tax=Aliivibrio finisterrensis TaxID=511998 RepID=A0A4Q5KXE2_9GAMM|nr:MULTISPECIES: type VI secretion system baseplate subunit TssE [Aliivibrio]MDD9179291.1 type VI secretion system baseplate subunit TssE [Aliivibrio sp. A6]RYU47380.1 type VI secretion system baseplate subunit TssE [Aliivibrio finisterrensis]RYU51127.1 type VI secretion system baseplate subunit TssE [Aliivibrio finisterrensis]RYU55521.1 type VI secretion system baseplate subunit TssE [Aliivibrio finisterrensis]RYU60381.1 type VI secretion system baseplate subunit TssE [Aliivibrio finisterrens
MASQRLFERLLTGTTQYNQASTTHAITESIRAHVAQLLSTRQGAALIRPDLGLPDLNMSHMTPHDAILHVKREVERVITCYESRLSNIQVRYLGDIHSPLHLYFDIQGDVILNGQIVPISFTTNNPMQGAA